MFIDTFTSLDSITKKQSVDDGLMLTALKKAGRFSCWDMDDSRQLWRAVNRLKDKGLIRLRNTRTVKGEANEPDREVDTYPWTYVELTSAPQALRDHPLKGPEDE